MPNPLANPTGAKASASTGLASLLEGKESTGAGTGKGLRKKSSSGGGEKKVKKESPRGFFEDLLTK
jgi:hypothetical protein